MSSTKWRWLWIAGIASLILVIGVGSWWGLSFQSKRAAIQRVMTEWKAIDNECWPQLVEGDRPETPAPAAEQETLFTRYFGRAKQIDLSGCPPDFSAAFADYIAAKEQHDRSLFGTVIPGREMQNLLDIPAAAGTMYEAYDRLEAVAQKYRVQLK